MLRTISNNRHMSAPYKDQQSPLFCSPDLNDDDDLDKFSAFELSTDLVMRGGWDSALSLPRPPGWSDAFEGEKNEESEYEQQEGEEQREGQDRDDSEEGEEQYRVDDDEEQGGGHDRDDGENGEQDLQRETENVESAGGEDEKQDEGKKEVDEKEDNLDVHTPPLNNPPHFTDGAISPPVFHDEHFDPKRAERFAPFARRSVAMAQDAAAAEIPDHDDERDYHHTVQDHDDSERESEATTVITESITSDESLEEDYEPLGFHYQGLAWRDDPRVQHMTTNQLQAQMDAEKEDRPRAYRQPDDLGDVVRWLNDQRERRAVRAAKEGKGSKMHRWAPY